MQADRMGNWWVAVVVHFLSVEINGLGNCLEQSKLYMLTDLYCLNVAVEGTVLVLVIHLEKQVGLLCGANTGYCTGGKHLVNSNPSRNIIQSFKFSDLLENNTINVN
jgi:hypothetical protein